MSSVSPVTAALARYDATQPSVRAFLSLNRDDALAQAAASAARVAAGQSLGPLEGEPVALKDNIAVLGQPLTCASRILENFVSPYDATVSTKLKAAGAVLFGRCNLDEFAMGSTTESSAFHKTCNPWDLTRSPGGSSGGSAAAVASGVVRFALGSDTGGSIRQPAHYCGVVGLKPTYGLVSRFGLAAYASSLDQIGPIARTVDDVALLLSVIAGADTAHDSTSRAPAVLPDYRAAAAQSVAGLRVGVPKEYFAEGLSPDVRAATTAALEKLRAAGATLVDVSLPHSPYAIATYYIIATAEASSNLSRYDGIRYTKRAKDFGGEDSDNASLVDLYFKSRGQGFGEEVKRRIILGTYVLSSGYYDAYYLRAQKVRKLIQRDYLEALKDVDVLAGPVAPDTAPLLGEKSDDPLAQYLSDIHTVGVNLAGLPALSVPCGRSRTGLPIGLQLIGKPFGEPEILRAAAGVERDSGLKGLIAPSASR